MTFEEFELRARLQGIGDRELMLSNAFIRVAICNWVGEVQFRPLKTYMDLYRAKKHLARFYLRGKHTSSRNLSHIENNLLSWIAKTELLEPTWRDRLSVWFDETVCALSDKLCV